ncbi:hypothetical protein HRbin40_02029 [bacterium HR40]|nr:hypothetical protein HRbin40_02029 [bacterium HR40]
MSAATGGPELTFSRRLKLALRAALSVWGIAPSGVFVPWRAIRDIEPIPYPAVERLLAARQERFRALLVATAGHSQQFAGFRDLPPAPRFDQEWFPRLDAAIAYSLVRHFAPNRILEVGCGHSTRFLVRAVADGGFPCEISCIDPAPRVTLSDLPVRHRRERLEAVPEHLLTGLAPGDVLFVDSSHLALPGSDVDRLFHHLLPELPAGVLVHVHDVFLPDPYPAAWNWRGYNEQMLVASWLLAGGLDPLFASHYVVTRMPEAVRESGLDRLPLRQGVRESSLWVRTQGPRACAEGKSAAAAYAVTGAP